MKLVISPAVAEGRLRKIVDAAAPMTVVQAHDEGRAAAEIADADALFGYLTPPLLRAARQLRWAQAPTASMERYLYPELVADPVVVTQMRGVWHARGREPNELPGYGGPGEVHPSDRAALTLADCTLGVVGMGGIGT